MEEVPRFGFASACIGLVIVDPPHKRRERHQYRLSPAPCLQPEVRPAVIDQVELDVAPAADQLKLALALGVRLSSAPVGYGKIRWKKRPTDSLDELEDEFDPALVCNQRFTWSGRLVCAIAGKVVEEDTAHSARLISMLKEEILVAPFLESGIELRAELITGRLQCAMEMNHVFQVWIIRSQVGAAAKPASGASFKIAEVRVDRRHE